MKGLAEQVRDVVQAAFDAAGAGVPVRFGTLTAEPGELPRAMLAPMPAENPPGDYVSGEAVSYMPLALYLRVRPLSEGDRILDPFAGGSVRGIVAHMMGRRYTGVELRQEQVDANVKQGVAICDECPEWVVGDSARIDELVEAEGFDYLFTCPPYADLEVYSDDPADISNMPFEEFAEAYATILAKSVAKLADDRFATVVIGDARDKRGFYRNLPGLTVEAMEAAGARYYNEAVLVTPAGSLPIRAGKQFEASRKLGKTHQNVLTFVKGDPKAATRRLGPVHLPEFGYEL